ncbi:chromate transporter [Treponema pedis]|uniref:Chromate transporter n=1 Tax=Treponema pedis str. T A4 TaxID=1291379 RepID=S6A4B5_9SPIR|nr:chromate transporter [Treponema pedis]AGT44301.1 chromate transporter [Treponema pedis str. T A4]QSI05003.1 chromate transporter [Treponema pedis]
MNKTAALEKLKILFSLFFTFFKIGAVTFGGGLAMLPILKRDLADSKKWITEEEIIDYFAIGQCTPGIIAVNVATFVGYKKCGIIGAAIATFGIVLPSLITITVIAGFIESFSEIFWVKKALKGINIAVSVLLLRAVFDFGKKTVFDVFTLLIAVFSFSAMFIFKVQGIWIVAFSAFSGWLIQTLKAVYKGDKK